MIRLTKLDLAYMIALLTFFAVLAIGLLLIHFTVAIVTSIILFFVTWHYALKWLDYVWPQTKKSSQQSDQLY